MDAQKALAKAVAAAEYDDAGGKVLLDLETAKALLERLRQR